MYKGEKKKEDWAFYLSACRSMVFWIRVKANYDTKRDKKCTRSPMKVSVGVAQFWLEQPIAILQNL